MIYFILTCGLDTGNEVYYINNLCRKKGFKLKGFILMKNVLVVGNALNYVH